MQVKNFVNLFTNKRGYGTCPITAALIILEYRSTRPDRTPGNTALKMSRLPTAWRISYAPGPLRRHPPLRHQSPPGLSQGSAGKLPCLPRKKPEESLSAADAEPGKEKEHVYSVTELCRNLDQQLSAFGHFRVEAEISGFKRYSSGHWYFTLKDENSCVSAAMFSFQARYCTFVPKDGDKVIADCTASVYAKSGRLTVKVSKMVPAGRGSVLQALEELKKKLTAEGALLK